MLYQMHALQMEMAQPLHQIARTTRTLLAHPLNPFAQSFVTRNVTASLELFERLTDNYGKPEFGFSSTFVDGREVPVHEEIHLSYAYCDLLRFKRRGKLKHPKLLIVAPMSGHYATLLRGTVEHFLPDHDVYITDWRNAREVREQEGPFHLDDYISYLMDFMNHLGPDSHVLAVCQASVPALVATALMSMDEDNCVPATLSLMAGPIDPRISPTEVNDYASTRDLEWFEERVISEVPPGFPGVGQAVYPGFIQLAGFMSMNMDNHVSKHHKFYYDLIKGDGESSEAHRKFYNEYLAVMDMAADYYLETIRKVFLDFDLPRRCFHYREQLVDTNAITKTALLTIEGEQDDITGLGQTHAAHELCQEIPEEKRQQYTQASVGHYGVFNGGKFRRDIGPTVRRFIREHGAAGQ